jgi:hypothetical protein
MNFFFIYKGYIDRKERSRLKSKNLRFQIIAKQFEEVDEIDLCMEE